MGNIHTHTSIMPKCQKATREAQQKVQGSVRKIKWEPQDLRRAIFYRRLTRPLEGRGHSDDTIRNWAKGHSSPNKVALSRAARTYAKRHSYKSKRGEWSPAEYQKKNEAFINANVKAMDAVASLTPKVAKEIDETVANIKALEDAEDALEEVLTNADRFLPFDFGAKAADLHDNQLRYAALCHGAPP